MFVYEPTLYLKPRGVPVHTYNDTASSTNSVLFDTSTSLVKWNILHIVSY